MPRRLASTTRCSTSLFRRCARSAAVDGTRLGDDGPEARLHFEEAFGYEFADHFVRGVGVDLQILAEGSNGGEALTGSHVAG